uniref:Uncharacterized protein n=1 Tax=viral metagenome TaxID=1070528 RepID=A0A6C0J6F2_9ZZZZ
MKRKIPQHFKIYAKSNPVIQIPTKNVNPKYGSVMYVKLFNPI